MKKSKFSSVVFGATCAALSAAAYVVALRVPGDWAPFVAGMTPPTFLLALTFFHRQGWFGLNSLVGVRVTGEDENGVREVYEGSEAVEYLHGQISGTMDLIEQTKGELLGAGATGFYRGYEVGYAEAEAGNEEAPADALSRYMEYQFDADSEVEVVREESLH